jgi:hypothetical protein
MFEHYIKLFHLGWVEPWVVEAAITMVGALLLALVLCKFVDFMNQIEQ